jgi:elongator complex protein 3
MTDNNFKDLEQILNLIQKVEFLSWPIFRKILNQFPKNGKEFYSKEELVFVYRELIKTGKIKEDQKLLEKIQMKPTRSQSGVAVVTVLTKPFPCPGQCIFCPNDIRMPKSYLSDEPGAQRAERNVFDPYLQTYRRLTSLHLIGHSTDKIEIIILGGTWSFYPEGYQIWFIKRIFEALNEFSQKIDNTLEIEKELKNNIVPKKYDKNYLSKIQENQEIKNEFINEAENITKNSKTTYNTAITKIMKDNPHLKAVESASWEDLEKQQILNEKMQSRCVGLVIETRPDKISPEEVIRIRRLGCTKTQIGFQSLQDEVLDLNKRGHKVAETRYAVKLLRQAGFKIHGHWMANLYGSSPQKDIEDYLKMFADSDFCPDELKIYPCSLIETADLVDYYEKGLWKPYTFDELLEVVTKVIEATPEYCRLTRIIRDIPGTDIMVGNKITNFRQVAENKLIKDKIIVKDIRSREVKNLAVTFDDLELKMTIYPSSIGYECFLQFVTKENLAHIKPNLIAGFLRLSLINSEFSKIIEASKNLAKISTYNIDEKININFDENSSDTDIQEQIDKISFKHPFLEELDSSAMIREIHVYGRVVGIGDNKEGMAQHLGLGKKLIETSEKISKNLGYPKLAVISAIGTREYYKKRGFELTGLYQVKSL